MALLKRTLSSFNPCFTGSTTSTPYHIYDVFEHTCFNPCFTGSTTSTIYDIITIDRRQWVSILVLLEVPLQLNISFKQIQYNITFQSLFYWKYHFNDNFWVSFCSNSNVSILVLLEVPLQLDIVPYLSATDGVSILVLLEVPLQRKLPAAIHHLQLVVSILVLLEVPLQRIDTSTFYLCTLSFNPCFTGSTTSTIYRYAIKTGKFHVSILVLLEVPLQQGNGTSWRLKLGGFQSLFYWKYHFNTTEQLCLM